MSAILNSSKITWEERGCQEEIRYDFYIDSLVDVMEVYQSLICKDL